ncbi:MAG: NAD+ synthase [Candidatus Omnitrophica bacterium]|nr:NAD+ synthase [Candidatus Omnitrophota bacterium]MBU1933578.1 NAD+ synthase [Candidatus Omnitrophota bacterium]
MDNVRIALAQINTIVGGLKGNTDRIMNCIGRALEKGTDIVIFPELAVTGYPPEDLLLKPHFIEENLRFLRKISAHTKDIIAVVGFVNSSESSAYNSAAILNDKKTVYVYNKMNLPNYGVFDEKRYFKPGCGNALIKARDFSFVVNICEDIWVPESKHERELLSRAQFIINISASPYCLGKIKEREKILIDKAKRHNTPIVYCNLIGGQDELVFDGRSAVFNKDGRLLAEARAFEEDLLIMDLALKKKNKTKNKQGILEIKIDYKSKQNPELMIPSKVKKLDRVEEVYSALALGVHDYVTKNNFSKVILGISGGIDSALVACVVVDALGKANVLAISMPSMYSSKETQGDAEKIARNLGIRLVNISISGILNSYLSELKTHFVGMKPDITEENLQARIRGNLLMAFSNKFGYLVLNTGNKSETSVGYCTLYGDMTGGFAVIKDVPKRLVYEMARYKNKKENKEIIPESVLTRSPSAELRPDQKDQDALPPYDVLDKIIDLYIEEDMPFKAIAKRVGDVDLVKKVLRMVDVNEYKRRQASPGIKITPRAFGRDRRMPITNKYTEVSYERHDK